MPLFLSALIIAAKWSKIWVAVNVQSSVASTIFDLLRSRIRTGDGRFVDMYEDENIALSRNKVPLYLSTDREVISRVIFI